jgi:hypothetical protein
MSQQPFKEVCRGAIDSVRAGTLGAVAMSASDTSPTVVEIMRFEDLPLGSRRAIVRWSDGSEGEALSWYADEIPSARAT